MPQIITHITTLNDSPDYVAAIDTLDRLKADETRSKLKMDELEALLKEDQTQVIREYEVQSLLSGHRTPGKQGLNQQFMRLREESAVRRAAITLQQQVVKSKRDVASREICKRMRPQYDAALRAMVLALLGATNSAIIASNIRDHLDSSDVSLSSLPHLMFPETGRDALEPFSRLSYLTKEALSLGFIERGDVPDGWLTRWGI